MPSFLDSTASSTLRGNGNVTINAAPPSGRFRACTCPPCCTMIFCTTASPSPVPFAFVVKNGRNSFGIAVDPIPGPLSNTVICCEPASSPRATSPRTSTLPPCSADAQASAAFRARFRSACLSNPSSPSTSPNVPSQRIFTCGSASPTSAATRSTTVFSVTVSSGISRGLAYFKNSATTCVISLVCRRMRPAYSEASFCDASGQFSQRGQILLELHPLLQCCKLRQIRQQTDRAADAFRPAPDRRNRHSQMPRISRRGNMLHFFATVNLSRQKALRQQLRQVRVLTQRFAVPPESQPVNSQHLFRRRI